MLDSPIIDIAIGLSFLFFLLGLITSSINEIIHTWLKTRSKELKFAIQNFLDRDWDEIGDEIVNSPYVRSLKKDPDSFPSYIPSSSFAQSVIDVIKQSDDLPEKIDDIKDQIRKNELIKGDAEKWLLGMIDKSYGSLDKLYDNLEEAYNNAMDRVSGWYVRKVKRSILILSIITSVLLNIDTVDIVKSLWQNKENAKAFSSLVASSMENVSKNEDGFMITDDDGKVLYSVDNNEGKNISNVLKITNDFPIPYGWNKQSLDFFGQPKWILALLSKLVGWAITALAIFLGAPFWFDLLGKIVNLRGSGSKPEVKKAGK